MTNNDYSALADSAELGLLKVKQGTTKRGAAASAAGFGVLKLAVGRRPTGSAAGASPVIRARVPKETKAQLDELAKLEDRAESELVRDAIAMYLKAHAVL